TSVFSAKKGELQVSAERAVQEGETVGEVVFRGLDIAPAVLAAGGDREFVVAVSADEEMQ
ncbi:hypothetical protein KIPB_001593, partial [Kipferlia bialata]